MLIIPTSLDTAIAFELRPPVFWAAVTSVCLTIGVYCLWEMLISVLLGAKPRTSRWLWLAASGVLLAVSAVSSGVMFGPVTFNADRADWVSTSWGVVFGGAFIAAFSVCAVVLLALRAADAVRLSGSGQRSHLAWRLLGLSASAAYGILLAPNEQMVLNSALQDVSMIAGLVLAVVGIGGLLALTAIKQMRSAGGDTERATSV